MELVFHDSGYGMDFEDDGDWPEGWPHDMELPDGSHDYIDPFIKFKAYDTSTQDWIEPTEFAFECEVKLCYETTSLWCEDVIASFGANDKKEAERLLQLAADAIYGKER